MPAAAATDTDAEMKAGTTAPYVQRLALAAPCGGRGRASRSAVDLSAVLGHAPSLAALVRDLLLPFERLGGVDQVVALHAELATDSAASALGSGREGEEPAHRFTSAIAGAMAGAQRCAYGELTVLRTPEVPGGRPRKRSRTQPVEEKERAAERPAGGRCERIATVDIAELGLSVEMRRSAVARGARVLLVVDWIDEVETVLAARDAVLQLGGDVAGVGVVVASGSHLLRILKAAQIPYACAWTPSFGGELAIGPRRLGSRRCICHQPREGRAAASGGDGLPGAADAARKMAPRLAHFTAQYQANAPCEDRSLNLVKEDSPDIRVYAVFDGHGGTLAVEHVKATLCRRILASVSLESSAEEVVSAMSEAFASCDQELKQSLLALPSDLRTSKGYCNAGSCAVVALFVGAALFVANVGDCAAVVGRTDGADALAAARGAQVTVDHVCSNAEEVRLVLARSRDRHPIRQSKDEQGDRELVLGVKRVAGSLAVTRAFGDFYLKCEELSTAPFKSKLPYITAEPSVAAVELDGSEQYLVLASDGLWEVLTPDEAAQIVQKFDPTQELFFSTASAALIHAALEKTAHRDGMLLHEVLALPQGAERRRVHDDITCTVVYMDQQQRRRRRAEGPAGTSAAAGAEAPREEQ